LTRSRRFVSRAIVALAVASPTQAAPLAAADIAALCRNAEDQAHCGRLIEARQIRRVARIVERDGDELRVSLAPTGMTVFRDRIDIVGAKSYAVWDYYEDLDTLVLFATDGDRTSFLLVQRRGGDEYRVPSEPVLAPDGRHFATANFCARDCDNEVAVWRIEPQAIRKEASWAPATPWTDVSVAWKGRDTIALEYSLPAEARPRTVDRHLGDPSWKRAPAR
jgi:hypothetical protein